MRLPIFAAALLVFINSIDAAKTVKTYSQEICYTQMGSKSIASVPTNSKFVTKHYNRSVTVKSTSTITQTPAAATITLTPIEQSTTTITNAAITDTLTVTSTPFTTSTSTKTNTQTITATDTVSTTTTISSTTTITNPAVTPIRSQLASLNYNNVQRRKDDELAIRGSSKAQEQKQVFASLDPRRAICPVHQTPFPNKVSCKVTVEVITYKPYSVKGVKTSTVTAPQVTNSVTSTKTNVVTVTEAPHVSLTVTDFKATSTITSTVTTSKSTTTTVLTTSTSSVFLPIQTQYAACQSNNYAQTINSKSIVGAAQVPSTFQGLSSVEVANIDLCCSACQSMTNCFSFFFTFHQGTASRTCFLFLSTSTSSPADYGLYLSNLPSTYSYQIGNGPNGVVRAITIVS